MRKVLDIWVFIFKRSSVVDVLCEFAIFLVVRKMILSFKNPVSFFVSAMFFVSDMINRSGFGWLPKGWLG